MKETEWDRIEREDPELYEKCMIGSSDPVDPDFAWSTLLALLVEGE